MNRLITHSRVGLGTASLHHLTQTKKKFSLLEAAFDSNIRYFDTAPLYGHESSERILGRFVRSHQSRNSVVIATKLGLLPNPTLCTFPFLLTPYIALRAMTIRTHILRPAAWKPKRDYSPTYLTRRVERSLRIMGLDNLDIVYLHDPCLDEAKKIDELIEAAQSLKSRGLVRAFGISAHYEIAQWIQRHAPELSDVLQIEIPVDPNEKLKTWFASHVMATFGHFRVLRNEISTLPHEERLKFVTDHAVDINPTGTILFSSNNKVHIAEFVEAINNADSMRREDSHLY